jgi:hypothetical protein
VDGASSNLSHLSFQNALIAPPTPPTHFAIAINKIFIHENYGLEALPFPYPLISFFFVRSFVVRVDSVLRVWERSVFFVLLSSIFRSPKTTKQQLFVHHAGEKGGAEHLALVCHTQHTLYLCLQSACRLIVGVVAFSHTPIDVSSVEQRTSPSPTYHKNSFHVLSNQFSLYFLLFCIRK